MSPRAGPTPRSIAGDAYNANLAKELFDVHRFYDVADMRRRA